MTRNTDDPAPAGASGDVDRAGDWRHAKWCRWERGGEPGECDCGLDPFRAALSSPAVAWEALLADLSADGWEDPATILARHRPLIEAALRAAPATPLGRRVPEGGASGWRELENVDSV